MTIAFILPPRESFTPTAAGAIAMVVQRLAGAIPGATVCGAPQSAATYPAIAYAPVASTRALTRALRRLAPSSIDVHQQPRLAIALSLLFPRTRIMLFLHNDPLSMRGLKSRFARRLARARLHRVVCVSDYLAARYMHGLTGAPPAVLPNPLTLADLPPSPAIRTSTILFAGRIVPDKAPDVFVAACALALPCLPGWRATLIGGDRFGPASPQTAYVTQIHTAAAAAGVACTGALPHEAVLAAMAAAAIVVVPSRWPEPFGLTALEAIASGAALITTPTGGLPQAAGDAAIYIPADDTPALAAAIIALAQNPAHRATLAAAGRSQARNFDTPIIAAALEKLRQTV